MYSKRHNKFLLRRWSKSYMGAFAGSKAKFLMLLTIESDGQGCQYDRGRIVGKIILYHGSPNETIMLKFGLGEEKHDYGKGFYLTESLELAKEWAVYRPNASNGWVHEFELDTDYRQVFCPR